MFKLSTDTFTTIVVFWIIFALILFPILLKITVPYGRHSRSNWGPMVSNKVAWIMMEWPALFIFAFFVIASKPRGNIVIWIFFAFWLLHYINRVFIFPNRIKTKGKKMPVIIMLFGVFFNFMNAFIIGYWFGFLSPIYSISWLYDPRFIIGVLLFFTGMIINQRSDNQLLSLRSNKTNGYSIPYGGMFKYVSCPNFFGEMIEWGGFALMTWCVPSLSFLIWTMVNLIPRALDHHRWYSSTFSDYPVGRKAVFPFIL